MEMTLDEAAQTCRQQGQKTLEGEPNPRAVKGVVANWWLRGRAIESGPRSD
jgi:hypothetical protein